MKLSKHRGETGEACGVARKIVPVTMPHVYKVPILVFGEWKYQLPWKQQKRKSYQLPPSELFLEAGRLQSKEIEHNHDTARGTHTHTSQKTERTRANTLAHAHTHKHKRRIRMTKHCLQLVFAGLAEFYVSSSWVPTAISQTRVAQFSMSRQPRLQFWSFRLRKMMCLTDFAKG